MWPGRPRKAMDMALVPAETWVRKGFWRLLEGLEGLEGFTAGKRQA